jgi:uncharacterized Ntn-hydrolase superfamily protein
VTYSIVARDPATGELGVAVQSHFFSVGSVVSYAEPGVGAVATQSLVDPSYGPKGLDLMRKGQSAPEALHTLLALDPEEAVRQVAMVDANGRVAVHTGGRAIKAAGHRLGEQVSVQANMMLRDTVWDAMLAAYDASSGDLASRLLAALDAAEAEGGDIRGRQSAALLVVRAQSTSNPMHDKPFDLRVEDHPRPVPELRRLVEMKRAYDAVERGDDLAGKGDLEGALLEYTAAQQSQPDNVEMAFWRGVMLAANGRVEEAKPFLERAYAAEGDWADLLRRLPAARLFPDDPALLDSVLPRG